MHTLSETQFLVCLLGEHLNEEQVQAIFASLDFAERPCLPFEPDVAKILKFMNPLHHRRDVKQLGSILDNEPTAVVEEPKMFAEIDEFAEAKNPIEWVKTAASKVMQGVDEFQKERVERKQAQRRQREKEADQFTTWFDAMGNNQLKMQQELGDNLTHFG